MDIKRNSKSLEMKYTYNSKGSQNMKDMFNLLLIERRKHCCVNSIEEDDDNSIICARRNNSCVLFEQDFESEKQQCSLVAVALPEAVRSTRT